MRIYHRGDSTQPSTRERIYVAELIRQRGIAPFAGENPAGDFWRSNVGGGT